MAGAPAIRGPRPLGAIARTLRRAVAPDVLADLAALLTTAPTHGAGASVDLVRRIVGGDVEAVDLLDRALQRPAHRPSGESKTNGPTSMAGNGQEKALRRLRKDRPDLHAEVLAGHLSAHAAMVGAGYRPKTATSFSTAHAQVSNGTSCPRAWSSSPSSVSCGRPS